MIKESISKITDKINLTETEAEAVMREIMEGRTTASQIAAYIIALRMKGETVEEITGSARVMREKAVRIRSLHPNVVDTCGTGGDRMNTFNISTATAFVVAGAGIPVAKHGNRSVSSKCGSADVLKNLGVRIDCPPEKVEECLDEIGIGFIFAPLYHGAMKHAIGPRQEIGVRTIFNVLGPLTNPAGASIQVLGVYNSDLTDLVAQVLMNLGSLHCFCVWGHDGLDEITITTKTKICEGKAGTIKCYHIEPKDFDIPLAQMKDIQGGTPAQNGRIIQDILNGLKGPKRDIILMNAAPAIVATGKAKTLQEGVKYAAEAIDTGAAYEKLEALKAMTNR